MLADFHDLSWREVYDLRRTITEWADALAPGRLYACRTPRLSNQFGTETISGPVRVRARGNGSRTHKTARQSVPDTPAHRHATVGCLYGPPEPRNPVPLYPMCTPDATRSSWGGLTATGSPRPAVTVTGDPAVPSERWILKIKIDDQSYDALPVFTKAFEYWQSFIEGHHIGAPEES